MPEPSRLVTLDQLHDLPLAAKVRFLGCVHAYEGQTARLILRTQHPATDENISTAIVSIENLLETTQHDLVEIGAWLNIIGYVRPMPPTTTEKSTRSRRLPKLTFIEATMVWSAGAIMLDRYDAAVKESQQTSSVIKPAA